jgi:6-phosphogluconolactonase (cycloisomerase 2 family)
MQRREFLGSAAMAAAAMALPWGVRSARAAGMPRFAYIGSYTHDAPGGWSGKEPAVGISVATVDGKSGALTVQDQVESDNPSFLALHHNGKYLYAINEIDDYEGKKAGSVEAYAVDESSGAVTLINRQALSGPIPAHLAVDPSGKYLVVALYFGAAYDVLPIGEDGSLGEVAQALKQTGSGPNEERQEQPHPHAVLFDPQGKYLATADLGIDKVEIMRLSDGKLERVDEVSLPPGSGPRHVAFHPEGTWLYVINELNATIVGCQYDQANGTIGPEVAHLLTVPPGFPPERSTAEIMVHPSGRFLYGSNRKFADHPQADAIVAFGIDELTGALGLIGYTTEGIQFPRAFQLDPTGAWLYALSQKGDTIRQYAIDQEKGSLEFTGNETASPTPVSLVFKS